MTSRHSENKKAIPAHAMNAYKETEGTAPLILKLGRSVPRKVPRYQMNRKLLGFRAPKCEEIIPIVPKLSGQIIVAAQ